MPGSDPGLPGGPATRGPAPGQTGPWLAIIDIYALGPYSMSKTHATDETDQLVSSLRGAYSFSLCRLPAMESKEAWPSLVMTESQRPRHRRGLGPARDEPPSQNRVHGWGSVCCVMRSCPARGHGNQGDDEMFRIWACKSRRCRPPQTGVPATRENIAASTTHDSEKTLSPTAHSILVSE
jgi:hypothetical protein